ncbi:hypothetical protein CLOP_g16176 [Closterium sp. NIES-67]|nr:hypothetical protein CLOP_g16176 [Closterium sp. NIES-67]
MHRALCKAGAKRHDSWVTRSWITFPGELVSSAGWRNDRKRQHGSFRNTLIFVAPDHVMCKKSRLYSGYAIRSTTFYSM